MSKNLEKLVTANYGSVEEFKRRVLHIFIHLFLFLFFYLSFL